MTGVERGSGLHHENTRVTRARIYGCPYYQFNYSFSVKTFEVRRRRNSSAAVRRKISHLPRVDVLLLLPAISHRVQQDGVQRSLFPSKTSKQHIALSEKHREFSHVLKRQAARGTNCSSGGIVCGWHSAKKIKMKALNTTTQN